MTSNQRVLRDLFFFGAGVGFALLVEQFAQWLHGQQVDWTLTVIVVSCVLMAGQRVFAPTHKATLLAGGLGFVAIASTVAVYTWARLHP
jgi:hypothetical protein